MKFFVKIKKQKHSKAIVIQYSFRFGVNYNGVLCFLATIIFTDTKKYSIFVFYL